MIVVLGVAGSGKSTQSQLLAARDGMRWVSMGEVLRRVITDDRRDVMLAGKVLDEHETIEILSEELTRLGDNPEIILDGFPRGLIQAEWLLKEREEGRFAIRAVVHLRADKNAVKTRLLARGRQDDTEDAIAERFAEYEEKIKPIVSQFSNHGIPVVDINAERSAVEVGQEIIAKLAEVGVDV
ncbi:MAG: nucleoside monophosphate kinase [Candidatus Saccharimonadales bacterium]